MLNNDEKRIIRIKNLESNCIEEMIVILKNNNKKMDKEVLNDRFTTEYDDFIIREAYIILENYINDSESSVSKEETNEGSRKFKIDVNKLLNYLLIFSIIVVGYVMFVNMRK